jgi:hypothetical protein
MYGDDKPSVLGPLVSAISGVLFGLAWWLFLDVFFILDAASDLLAWYHFAPLLIVTLGLLVILTTPRRAIYSSGGGWTDTNMGVKRNVFFIGILLTLSGLGLAILLTAVECDGTRDEMPLGKDSLTNVNGNAPLISLSASAIIAVLATFLFKFCRPLSKDEDSW